MTVSTEETAVDPEVRAIAAERLTFFADAVIAIAITLLALELPRPEGSSNAQVLHSAYEHRWEYLAFLISFLVVGGHWSGHHRVFRYVTALDGRLAGLTMYWLLMQVLTPFATKVLTGDGAFEVRFICYASIQALSGVLFLLMVREVRRHHLYRPDTPSQLFSSSNLRTGALTLGFLVSIPLAFVIRRYSYWCWFVIPFTVQIFLRIAPAVPASVQARIGVRLHDPSRRGE
jgi:uncharacterized membrane protein